MTSIDCGFLRESVSVIFMLRPILQVTRLSPAKYQVTRLSPAEYQVTRLSPEKYQITQLSPAK